MTIFLRMNGIDLSFMIYKYFEKRQRKRVNNSSPKPISSKHKNLSRPLLSLSLSLILFLVLFFVLFLTCFKSLSFIFLHNIMILSHKSLIYFVFYMFSSSFYC